MKLSEYAKKLGLTYRTVWNHYKSGKISNAYQLPTGTIIVEEEKERAKMEIQKTLKKDESC